MYPLIINAAVSGSAHPDTSPHLPRTPEDVGREALACARAGAAIVHIHARDGEGLHSGRIEHFRAAVEIVRNAGSDVIINLTTSFSGGSERPDPELRMSVLDLEPDIASFDAGTLNFNEWVFRNDPAFLRALARRMQDRGVKPEIEVFDEGMLGTVEQLTGEGLLDDPLFIQFVLGVRGGARATPENLVHLVRALPRDSIWSVAAIGRHQLNFNAMAIAMGGHARTGLEDNIYFTKGEYATNEQLVARVRHLADVMGREVATPTQARGILQIPTRR